MPNYNLKLLILIILCLIRVNSFAQSAFYFSITDVGTKEKIGNVNVQLMSNNYYTQGNSKGLFQIPDYEFGMESSSNLQGIFIGQNKSIFWHLNTSFTFNFLSINGVNIYSNKQMAAQGDLALNHLPNGLYFAHLNSPKGNRQYTIIVRTSSVILSQRDQNKSIEKPSSFTDTLLLSAENYYDLKIPINFSNADLEKVQDIKMLKYSYVDLHYFNTLISKEAFDMISSTPSKTHLSSVSSTKIIMDKTNNKAYYFDVNKYSSHFHFAKRQMDYPYDHSTFLTEQYRLSEKRYLYPLTLNYFKELDIYTFEFFSGDGATCEDISWCYEEIKGSSFIGDKLYFYATNESWNNCHDVPTITANELFIGQNYQALNLAENYGYLQKIESKDLNNTNLQKHDIVLTNFVPIDISVVAGIITTDFQTPLSHINVLSHNRGTPNMALKDGFTNAKLDSLIGKLIYLKVANDSFITRTANIEEAKAFWALHEPNEEIILVKDTSNLGLINLNHASLYDINKVGGKAANFAELLSAFQNSSLDAPVPEGHFAIPFHYYEKHLKENGLDKYIALILSDSTFQASSSQRKIMLKQLQDSIKNTPLNNELLELVNEKVKEFPAFTSFRFRSSTNAEDLENFNGAGLYSSFSGKLNHDEKTIPLAIKKVWASLWNFSAFEEREYFRINHQSCSMGILVHRSFPYEEANGVALTKNPYNVNHGYSVNVQFADISIVNPEPGIIHDQLVIYNFSISGKESYTLEYINHSNVFPSLPDKVMTKDELFELADYLSIIKHYFYKNVYPCQCNYNSFGLDVEFKVDSDISDRKIYVKQVRSY